MGLQEIFNELVYKYAEGLNHADIVKACEEVIKYSLINEEEINQKVIMTFIQDRKSLYKLNKA